MSRSTGRPYPLTLVCEAWRVPRSSVYALRSAPGGDGKPGKRGPKTELGDEELVEEIRTVLSESPFVGEGYRKVRARLAARGIRVGGNRVLRLMRENGLLAPVRRGRPRGDRSHGGRIRTERPDELWGTDAARFHTRAEGWCWFFGAVDHCVTDVVGWHVAGRGDRWAALEPVRRGVRTHMGGFAKGIAAGLGLRHDWGPQYRSRAFQAEIGWLGIRSTPAYVGEPECNGVVERFIRTLREECIDLNDFETLEEAREVIGGLHRALQRRLASPAARVSDPGPRPREARPQEGGLMVRPLLCPENRDHYTRCGLSTHGCSFSPCAESVAGGYQDHAHDAGGMALERSAWRRMR